MQSPAPSEYFPTIKFNYSFYTTGDTKVTLEYVNNNFLKCTGYAYSRAISTSFNGIIYALAGIETTNINATGTVTANLFSGSGAGLSNINATNISDGTLSVSRGGTGTNNLPLNQILIGNDTSSIFSSSLLVWDSNTDSLYGKFTGSGYGLTSLNVDNVLNGTLSVISGGTGANSFTAGRLLIGNGTNAITENGNLTWITASNILSITGDINITGAYKINNNAIVSSQWFTSGTTIEYNGGSVGIGTPALAFRLNVNGTTQTTSLTTTNIGIGITNPTTSSIEIVRPVISATDLINMRYDTTNGLRYQQAYIGVNDVKYNVIQKNNNIDTNILTYYKGNLGIGNTDPGTYKLNVTGSINASADISSNTLYATLNLTSAGNAYINNVLSFNTLYNGGGANFPCNKINLFGMGGNYGFGISGSTLDYFASSIHRWNYNAGGTSFGSVGMTLTNNNLSAGGAISIFHFIRHQLFFFLQTCILLCLEFFNLGFFNRTNSTRKLKL